MILNVYNANVIEAIHCTPLMDEADENKIFEWLDLKPGSIDLSEVKSKYVYVLHYLNGKTEFVDPATFISTYEQPQQWDNSARKVLAMLRHEEHYLASESEHSSRMVKLIDTALAELKPELNDRGMSAQDVSDLYISEKVAIMLNEFDDLFGIAQDDDEQHSSYYVEAAKERFKQVFNIKEV